jgi:DNA primase
LRDQITIQQVLEHLGFFAGLRGHGQQRRGPCPVHSQREGVERTFSVNLDKNMFQCFHAGCGLKGNALDLWAAVHRLPLYEAAINLAETFQLALSREEEPVGATRPPRPPTASPADSAAPAPSEGPK